jgi:putative glutamate/gamma-aminobutyrate antiporter
MVGTIIPAALLIILGIIYLATGGQSNMDFHSSFFPDFTNFDNVVLAASIFLFYAGMEMGGIHVKDVENPSKNYPKAVFIGALITVLIFVLGTFALGVIIPAKDINLTQSLLVGFDNYFKYIHASWLSPIIAIALAFGVLAGVLTWVAGPSKGIFAVGKAGYMPPFFQKTNKLGVQKNILFVQGLAVTVLSLLFVVMPSVQSFYQILSQLTVILYLIMYLLMFSGAIALRYKMKKLNRPFRIGKSGNGLIGGLGFCGSLLAFILSFIPPSQISTGSNTVWFSVLIIGAIIVVVAPFIIYASKKPSWVDPNSNFEPFHWEVQAQPATASPSVTKPSTTASGPSSSNSSAPSSGSSASTSTSLGSGDKDKDTPKS